MVAVFRHRFSFIAGNNKFIRYFTSFRFISNEGVIFGVMCAAMGAALKSYSGQKVSNKSGQQQK